MFNRREFFPLTSGLFGAMFGARKAKAATKDVKFDSYNMTEDMRQRFAIRFPGHDGQSVLDRESLEDFLGSFRLTMDSQYRGLEEDLQAGLAEQGIKVDPNCSLEEAWKTCIKHPRFAMKSRAWLSAQQLMWQTIQDTFHKQSAQLLAELETCDKLGPGKLELNPDMKVPEYCRYEIHIQPGGYVGDAFSGAIAAYGSKYFARINANLYNDHQERALEMAQMLTLPRRDVTRVLDMGTGWGPLATALKVRFPEAEVWGIDVGGPMVRWAHYRAVKWNIDVNFAQRLAEDTKFPDNHFDMVASHIMHHEVTGEATKKIVAEAFRILRPGGIFQPMDFVTVGNPDYKPPKTLSSKAATWQNHRYNNEVWQLQYQNTDLPGVMRSVGFVDVHASAKPPAINGDVMGYKPA